MKSRKKIIAGAIVAAVLGAGLAGCASQADTVSQNLSTDADSFKISRAIVFHDDLTDTNIASITGLCSLGNSDSGGERTVTCKIGPDTYVKEIFQMGNNTSVSAIQTQPASSDPYAYKVVFKPTVIDFDLQVAHK